MKRDKIALFERPENCCGCGACINVCPKGAISMKADEQGFLFPVIDPEKCIQCGRCKTVCAFQSGAQKRAPQTVYAAMSAKDPILRTSASGGVFAAVAEAWLRQGGLVYGCAMEYRDGGLAVEHVRIDRPEELPRIQGSKYVQSDTGLTFRQIRADLRAGKRVLFSGTPCQVAGLRQFLGESAQENLATVDIICHGVPSQQMFRAYIADLEKRLGGTVTRYLFRDKRDGWGMKGSVWYTNNRGKTRCRLLPSKYSSYFRLFLDGDIYRESCYRCPYADSARPGDLTLGDYWGIWEEHPEYLKENGGPLAMEKGVSCVLVNTRQGKELLEACGQELLLLPSELERLLRQNDQLREPSRRGSHRETVMGLLEKSGYDAVERWFRKQSGIKWYAYNLWYRMPARLRGLLKKE